MTSVGSTSIISLHEFSDEQNVIDEEFGIDESLSHPDSFLGEDFIEDTGIEEQPICTPKKPSFNDELRVGKEFKSTQEAYDCYNKYAGSNGFSIRRRSTDSTKFQNSALFVCSCEGNYKRQNLSEIKRLGSTMRSGCKAKLRITQSKGSDSWHVTIFIDEHNHNLVTPSKRILLKSNRRTPSGAKLVAECFKGQNVPICKAVSLFGERDKVSFSNRDLYNHMRDVRKIHYVEGDAESVKIYFQMKAAESPYFYYAIQSDANGRALNFFWIDARSRIAYGQFGDVITFDTTYNTNKYKMPFAPFTGVNHHRQSILFGCALLENEKEETFIWLFETWLHAMGGKAPSAIITDQDPAMMKAIAKVFPYAHHRFCLWHIKRKFIEKLSHIFYKRSKFKIDVKRCTRFCRSIEEFEEQWADLLVTYGLQDNNWLQHLYEIRKKWIPIYCQDTFFAGMNTTQRSESINSFFGDFVNGKTDLRTFVTKFDEAVLKIYVSERKEDFFSIYKKLSLVNEDYLLDHASSIYTRNLFVMFTREFNEHNRLRADETGCVGDLHTYSVRYRFGDTYEWMVSFNSATKEGSCQCKLFEFYGIPCKHLIEVFHRLYLTEIPPYFIMKRWMKDANRVQVSTPDGIVMMRNEDIGTEAARVYDATRRATQLAYILCRSDEGWQKLCEILDMGFKAAEEIDANLLKRENGMTYENEDEDPLVFEGAVPSTSNMDAFLLDPHISQTKGRKRATKEGNEIGNKRLKSPVEKKHRCKLCFGKYPKKHDIRNCPDNPINIKKKKKLIMALGGRI